ncbi:MAG: hypothetical protein IKS96_02755 [Fibrobacter sp.]|nr:hypothetical protein [Fibrobacter sp.]
MKFSKDAVTWFDILDNKPKALQTATCPCVWCPLVGGGHDWSTFFP